MSTSEFFNGDKRVVITGNHDEKYIVEYYISDKIVKRELQWSLQIAENLAEDFVYDGSSPKLLNE